MKVDIKYCVPCGFLPRAKELKQQMEKEFKASVSLTEGDKGVFDVTVNDKLLFSKHKEGRFPTWEEIGSRRNNHF